MNLKIKSFLACTVITLSFFQAACTYSVPEAPDAVLLNNADGANNRWNGIGKIFRYDRPYCSASLLDTRGPDAQATGPAYIMTNAHCASIQVGTAADSAYQGQMQFNYFHDTLAQGRRYDIRKVNWASFASTDVAIMELDTPLNSLLEDGINPLRLASAAPRGVSAVNVIGAPSSAPGLRLSKCTQEPSDTTLIKYVNVHLDYQNQNCKGIEPGSSGSPVIDASSGEVTGISSGTTYEISADDLCFWHGLCNDNPTPKLIPAQASQSFPVDYLSSCFVNGTFNLKVPGCSLTPNFSFKFTLKSRAISDIGLHRKPLNSEDKTPAWDIDFSMSTPLYRFKTVRDAHACYSTDQYSQPVSTYNARVSSPIGRDAGLHYLCLIGVESAAELPDNNFLRNTQILAARIVEPVATQLAEPSPVIESVEDALFIKYREADDRNLWTQVYTGPVGETDCAGVNPRHYTKVDDGFYFATQSLPVTLCSFTMDRNLSTSAVRTDQLQRPATTD